MPGTLSAVVEIVQPGTDAEFGGSGALFAELVAQYQRAAALSGAGFLDVASAFARYPAAANLSGAGAFTTAAYERYARAANLAGAGALTSLNYEMYSRSGAFLSTGQLDATATPAFTPFTVENTNVSNDPVPGGTCVGCWVTLDGGGGGGGSGRRSSSTTVFKGGGGGGGGAARFPRFFIAIADLGSTYSLTRGASGPGAPGPTVSNTDGSAGTAGGNSVFTSGSVTVTAQGGAAGGGGTVSTTGTGGAAGSASSSGLSPAPTGFNGTAGGNGASSSTATAPPNNTAGGAAGGGGSAGQNASGTGGVAAKGGDTTTGTGGAAGTGSNPGNDGPDQTAGNPGPGGGGAARNVVSVGDGGDYGGGGAGGTTATSGTTNAGDGGVGYTKVEWTDVVPHPVTFDAVGGGRAAQGSGISPANGSWTHTCSGSDRAVIVMISRSTNGNANTSSIVRSATYGGIPMTELAAGVTSGSADSGHMIVWGLLNPPTGPQTVQVNTSTTGNFAGNSVSYNGVGSFGAISTTAAESAGTGMSNNNTGTDAEAMVVAGFVAVNATSVAISGYSKTQRFNVTRGAWTPAIAVGDTPSTVGAVGFTAVRSSGVAYRTYGVELLPV